MNSDPLYIQMTMEVSYTRESPALTVVGKPSFSANRSVWSVYRSGFVEFENRYCSGY
jgi:hypothetical protein